VNNALVWSFDFDLRDMSNEVRVSAVLSLLFIEWRLCIDGVDWLFPFVSCFLIGSFSWFLIGYSAGNGDFWLVRFPAVDCLTMEHISIPIIGGPDVTGSIRILCTITLREDMHTVDLHSLCRLQT
jgi:hypothetical protein